MKTETELLRELANAIEERDAVIGWMGDVNPEGFDIRLKLGERSMPLIHSGCRAALDRAMLQYWPSLRIFMADSARERVAEARAALFNLPARVEP